MILDDEADVSVNATVDVKVAGGHRGNRTVGIVAAIGDEDGDQVVLAEMDERGDVDGEGVVAPLVFGSRFSVDEDSGDFWTPSSSRERRRVEYS